MGFFSFLGDTVGAVLGSKSVSDTNASNQAINERNIALQREFAQSGIRWKVADAKAAGIHPLYAIGGSGATFTPNSIAMQSDPHLANLAKSAGQNLGRAVSATQTKNERVQAKLYDQRMMDLNLERAALSNDLLRSQIQKNQLGPPMPSGSDGDKILTSPLHPDIPVGPHTSAQDVEDYYGGIAGEIYGAAKFGRDQYAPGHKKSLQRKNTASQGDYIRQMYQKRGLPVPKHLRPFRLKPSRRGRLPKFERR